MASIFYAWLPFLCGFVGFDIGLLLGRWMTGDIGITEIVLGVVRRRSARVAVLFS